MTAPGRAFPPAERGTALQRARAALVVVVEVGLGQLHRLLGE